MKHLVRIYEETKKLKQRLNTVRIQHCFFKQKTHKLIYGKPFDGVEFKVRQRLATKGLRY